MAPSLRSVRRDYPELDTCRTDAGDWRSPAWIGGPWEGWIQRTRRRAGAERMLANCLLSIGMVFLLVQGARATEGKEAHVLLMPGHCKAIRLFKRTIPFL